MKILSLMVVVMVSLTAVSYAATKTWDAGHATEVNWYANSNWDPDAAPVDDDSLVFAGTTKLSNNAYPDGLDVASLTFDNTAGAFVINNTHSVTLDLEGNITNDSSNVQTINCNIRLQGGNRTIETASGDITIGGVISNDGTARQLTKMGTGTLRLSAANSYNGTTVIGDHNTSTPGGVLEVQNDDALGAGSMNFNHGGTLELGVDGLTISTPLNWYNWGAATTRSVKLDLDGSNSGTMSGQITLRSGGSNQNVFEVGTNDTLTVSGRLYNWDDATKSSLTKTGAGTLVLSSSTAANYQSGTIINGGTLQLGDGGANGILPTHANSYISIADGATFSINQSDTVTQGTDFDADAITGAGNFVQAGSGKTTLNVINTYTGTTTVAGGTLELQKPNYNQWYASGALHINNGSTLQLSSASAHAFFFGNKSWFFDSNGGGTIEMVGDNINVYFQNDNTLTTAGGAENIITNRSINTFNGINAGTTTFDVADGTGDRDLTVASAITGEGAILKSGAGTLSFPGANSYSGATTIDAGWLELGVGGTAGSLSSSSTITNNGRLVVIRSDTVTQGTDFSGDPIVGSGFVMQGESSGRLVLNAANTYSGGTRFGRFPAAWGGQISTLEGGTIEVLDNSAIGTGGVTFEKGGTLELGVSGLSLVNSFFAGNWSSSPHTIRLDEDGLATGTLSGNVQIHDGTGSGFQVDVGTDDALTMSGKFYRTAGGGAGITKVGAGTLTLTGDSANPPGGDNLVGHIKVNAGTVQLGDGGSAGTTASARQIQVSAGATFAVNQSDTVTQGTDFSSSAISGDGGFTQAGSGKTVLNVANTYTGNTTISAGTLALSGSGTLGGGTYAGDISNSGTFKYNSPEDQELSGTISGSGTLNMVHNTSTLTLSGVGNTIGALNAAGGTLVLAGNSTTTVSGNIKVANSSVDDGGSGTLTVQDSASLTAEGGFSVGQENSVDGTVSQSGGTVTLNGSATIAVWSNLSGTYTMSDGTLNVTNSFLTLGWDGQGYLNVNGGTANLEGIRYGYGNNGARSGTLTLGGGTVNIGATGMYKEVGTINLNSGTLGALAGWSSTMDMTLGGSVDIDTTGGDIALSGDLSGSGTFTKIGSGTLTLSGANTYSGDTTVNAGVLRLASGGSLNTATTVRIASSAKMELDAGINQTVYRLYLGGALQASGTWGATGSGATNIDDTRFAGTGILAVTDGTSGSLFRFK